MFSIATATCRESNRVVAVQVDTARILALPLVLSPDGVEAIRIHGVDDIDLIVRDVVLHCWVLGLEQLCGSVKSELWDDELPRMVVRDEEYIGFVCVILNIVRD